MATSEVTRLELSPPPNGSEPTGMVALLERLAANPDVAVDKLERILALQERVMAKQAETDFDQALSTAQQEMGRISTDATNPQTRSKYATYGKLDKTIRPIYTRHGFALSFGTGESPAPELYVRVTCHVSHRGGHSRDYHIDMPADGKGARGGDVMTKTHATGAAASYGMRYLLKMIFNVAIGEDDRDGNGDEPTTITAQQVAALENLLKDVGASKDAFLKVCKVESLDQILARNYDAAVRRIEAKRKAAK